MTTPPKPEDEKCVIKKRFGTCHHAMCKPEGEPPQDWEKEFDEKFSEKITEDYVDELGRRHTRKVNTLAVSSKVKSFIRELLEKTREEAVEKCGHGGCFEHYIKQLQYERQALLVKLCKKCQDKI